MTPIQHFSPTASDDNVAGALVKDGVAIIDRLVAPEVMDRVKAELDPWLAATAFGSDEFAGKRTKRTGGLIARSVTCRELLQHPLVIESVKKVLSKATSIQIHLTQVIAIGPGEPAQMIHRDQWAFDFFPFPKGHEVSATRYLRDPLEVVRPELASRGLGDLSSASAQAQRQRK